MYPPAEKIQALEHSLKQQITGEVLFDRISRVLYSTDASNFQIEPVGIVLPRDADELCAIVEIANAYQVPIIPRGSGSSMAGQTLGFGLIIDCTKHLNNIHELDLEGRTVIVDPGVILDSLNGYLKAYGLMVGPDPASAERATIGGMVGNNATGAHSIRYGLTIDHVLATEVVLSDGSIANLEPLSEETFAHRAEAGGLEGQIYARMAELKERYAEHVRKHWPSTWRRASGYSLNYLTGFTPGEPPIWDDDAGPYPPTAGNNLTPLMVSSEGSLAILRKIKLNLVPIPEAKALAVLPFNSVSEAAEATPALLAHKPDAVELIPRTIFERAREIPAYARRMGFLEGNPAAILVIEFAGENVDEVVSRARSLPGAMILDSDQAMADLWAVRKVGLGLLMSVPGDTKPITFIEDVAVPVEHLSEFVRQVDGVLMENNTHGEWYAHASAGCLHLRPMVNLKTFEGVQQMQDIADGVIEIALKLKGSISGEHGDGLSHTEYNEKLFGSELLQAFKEIKRVFDPNGLLNPGKVIPAEDGFGGPGSLISNLRYGSEYQVQVPPSVFAHNREGGFASAIEACTGVGVCRQERGLMCPSYQATRDEIHTTRGRANALRAAMSGILPNGSLTSEEMYAVLDLCLECKGCKAECPTAVDMARIKAEFLYLYQQKHGTSLRSHLFANIHALASLSHHFAGLIALASNLLPSKWFQERLLGISRERSFPAFSRRNFHSWFESSTRSRAHGGKRIALYLDTYTHFMQPDIGKDAVYVLENLGFDVELIKGQVCCGRPMISKGFLTQARELARQNVEVLSAVVTEGMPIVGLEPSCLLTLRDEYLEFFPGDERVKAIASNTFLFEEFLDSTQTNGNRVIDSWGGGNPDQGVSFHNHCYTKALVGSGALVSIFNAVGADADEIPSGCCGMAGSFGYEKEHYDLSMQIAEQVLLPAARQASAHERVILAPGYSCRTQIRDGAGVEALHPAQYLASLLKEGVD